MRPYPVLQSHSPSTTVLVASKLEFVHFTPRNIDLPRRVYRSDRDIIRGDLREGFDTTLGVVDISMCYTAEEYARIIIWCLGWMLNGWPYYIPFTNLSNIKGGVRPLRILWDLWQTGTLKFVRAPHNVRERALHDPESVLPHVMAAAALPPLPRTLSPLNFDLSRFQDLLPRSVRVASRPCTKPTSAPSARPQAPAEEVVLHPDNLEPILSTPLNPDSARRPHERRQRCDANKARNRPTGKKSHSRKVGPLTSRYVLDAPRPSVPSTKPAGGKILKPLSEHRLPLMVDEFIGDYIGGRSEEAEMEDIESFSDVDG